MASYRKKHIRTKIHRISPRKSIFRKRWFWIFILIIIIASSALCFVLFYSGIQVKNIIIFGNQKVETSDIKNLISGNINNKILSIGNLEIYSKSIFLVNSDDLNKQILNKFPLIKSVKIDKKLPQTLIFQINERIPVAIFCPSLDETTGTCYFMDDNGVIFEPLYVAPQNIVIVRQAMNDSQIFISEKVVAQNIMDLLLKVEKNLKGNFQINLTEALVASPVRLDVTTDKNWQIYFDLTPDSDVNLQLTKLNLLLSGGISTDEIKNLRYIDLRPDSRAIICDNKTCGG